MIYKASKDNVVKIVTALVFVLFGFIALGCFPVPSHFTHLYMSLILKTFQVILTERVGFEPTQLITLSLVFKTRTLPLGHLSKGVKYLGSWQRRIYFTPML